MNSLRNEILLYTLQNYDTVPEVLWAKYPNYQVLRHQDNRKWYAIIMDVPRAGLGLKGEGKIDVMNVKCLPEMLSLFQSQTGFLPAYHMNKANWLTILLDGTVDKETVIFLLNSSFDLTATRLRKKALGFSSHIEWIVPANPKYYDVEAELQVGKEILWKQSNNIAEGDIVYLYVTEPTAAIRFKCEAIAVNLPYDYKGKDLRIDRVMRIKCLQEFAATELPREKLREFGVIAVRGPRKMPFALSEEIKLMANE